MFRQAVIGEDSDWDIENPANFDCFYPDFTIKSQPYTFQANCGDLTFYNKGTTTMIINGIQFAPGTGLGIGAQRGCMNVGRYSVTFSGAGTSAAFIMRQVFVKK